MRLIQRNTINTVPIYYSTNEFRKKKIQPLKNKLCVQKNRNRLICINPSITLWFRLYYHVLLL